MDWIDQAQERYLFRASVKRCEEPSCVTVKRTAFVEWLHNWWGLKKGFDA
jgi:hypothetical protein